MLVMEGRGRVPEQMGAVLRLEAGAAFDPPAVLRTLADRAGRVTRLRQRLVRTPLGCGPRIWVDDPADRPEDHLRTLSCPAPGDERALLGLAASLVAHPLPPTRPLWSAVLVTDLDDGAAALILLVHHVLTDGIGGLSILTQLIDPGPDEQVRAFPRPRPGLGALAVDALASRVRGVMRLRASWRDLRASVTAGGGLHPPAAADCSLLRRTGRERRFAVVRIDLPVLREATHRRGSTVNDALLVAVAGALRWLLAERGESVPVFRIAVMVGASAPASSERGNLATPLVVEVSGAGDPATRLAGIVGAVRAGRAAAEHAPMIALLLPVFRVLAAAGLYRAYLARQRRIHTLVSNVRGPGRPVALDGHAVTTIIPIAVGEAGNLTVNVLALSYAGTLVITLAVDPDHVPELVALGEVLENELLALTGIPAPAR
jgi:WS/DGAT/MGAT family acyltransferase